MLYSKRLESFDLLRLFFVLMALTAHYRVAQGAGYELPALRTQADTSLLNLPYHIAITRTSMSALLIIFGFMLEYVYASAWRAKGAAVVLEKMLTRTIICYLAFLTLAFLAIWVQGSSSLKAYAGTALFIYPEDGKAFLFKYYTLLIPIVFLLMWLRFRYGLLVEIMTVAALILLAEVIKANTNGFRAPFELIGANIFGVGNKVGPSVLHSLALVTLGRLTASYSLTRKADIKAWLLLLLVVLSVGAVGLEIHRVGFAEFVRLMASTKTYRAHNSHIYFAFGMISFLFFWVICWFTIQPLGPKIKSWISYYGGNTFIIFLYGNILLFFTPHINANGVGYSISLIIYLLLSLLCVNVYEWANQHVRVVGLYIRFIKSVVPKILSLRHSRAKDKDKTVVVEG